MFTRRTLFAAAAALAAAVAAAGPAPRPADKTFPATVLLIRHAEKPDDETSVDLSARGKERAAALPRLFRKSDTRPDPFPAPDLVFATKNTKHSHRPAETVAPLAGKLGLKVHADVADDDYQQLADELFGKAKYAGKTVLVCWHHGKLPDLARALKAHKAPDAWKGSVFDRVREITYDAAGKAAYRDRPQRLLPGDSAE